MLSAHLAPALIAKSFQPTLNLPAAILLCLLPDIIHVALTLMGVEKLSREERFSHSLLITFVSVVAVLLLSVRAGASTTDGIIYMSCVLSHFALDLVNRHRMLLTPWGGSLPGLGLHERGFRQGHVISFFLELALVFVAIALYATSTYDGYLKSLLIPAGLLVIMLTGEIWYFRVYAYAIGEGQSKRTIKSR